MEDCLFCKIAGKKIESDIVYEDDKAIVIKDIHPQAPVHDLVISKRHIPTILDLKEDDKDLLWHLFTVVNLVARKEGVADKGFRIVINCGSAGGQVVFHLHIHILGGRSMR